MKREITLLKRGVSGCCPGHDDYTNDTYKTHTSRRARSKHKTVEHKHARTIIKRQIQNEINEIKSRPKVEVDKRFVKELAILKSNLRKKIVNNLIVEHSAKENKREKQTSNTERV